jgi:4-hydroxybenzoate polyprenyltransferase
VAIPLLGAVTAQQPTSLATVLAIGAIGLVHHVFSFVLNDVVDLPIDRTEPRRSPSPLVQGLVSSRLALVVALLCAPLALWLSSLLGAGALAQGLLLGSLVMIAAYDVWGKKTPIPPVIDVVQGVGWALLACYGAEIAGGATPATALLAVFMVGYITLANGVHGGLRDLENDGRHGARTTALFLGAVAMGSGAVSSPPGLRRYALVLETVNTIVVGMMIVALGYQGWALAVVAAAWVGMSAASAWLLRRALAATAERQRMMVLGTGHLIASFGVALVVLVPVAPPAVSAFVVAVYAAPLLAYGWLFDSILRVAEPRSAR